jgi:hypothetical protein
MLTFLYNLNVRKMNVAGMIPTEKDFNDWWDSDYFPDSDANIRTGSPMWWAWQGWLAAVERIDNGRKN